MSKIEMFTWGKFTVHSVEQNDGSIHYTTTHEGKEYSYPASCCTKIQFINWVKKQIKNS